MRDSAARILPEWTPSLPLYGYLLGIYSFGLCETRDYEKATVMAEKVSDCQLTGKCRDIFTT